MIEKIFDLITEKQTVHEKEFKDLFYGGKIKRRLECFECDKPIEKLFTDRLKFLIVNDIDYDSKESLINNYLQAPTEMRFCSLCHIKRKHRCHVEIDRLPKILIIKIEDVVGNNKKVKIREKLVFNTGNSKQYFLNKGTY